MYRFFDCIKNLEKSQKKWGEFEFSKKWELMNDIGDLKMHMHLE